MTDRPHRTDDRTLHDELESLATVARRRTNARAAARDCYALRGVLPCLLLTTGCAPAPAHELNGVVAADHHVHILAPALVRDWQSLGVPFSRPDSAYTSVTAAFGREPEAPAFLVSMAHVYGAREFRHGLGLSIDEEQARVRAANDHVVREAQRFADRLVAFCSVDPLRPYAQEEIERCRTAGSAGLKLHLPSAGLTLGDAQQRALLAGIARELAAQNRPLLLHLVAVDDELSERDVALFIDDVVRPHPALELYLAHLGGNGGYRASAQRVVRALTDFLSEPGNGSRTVYVELSGALLAERTDGVPASRARDAQRLAADLRRLGLERVVFGSDYPVFDPARYRQLLQERLPLTPAEHARVLANRGGGLQRAATSHSR